MDKTSELINALSETAAPVKMGPSPANIFVRWIVYSIIYEVIMVLISGTRPDLLAKLHSPLYINELLALGAIVVTSAMSAVYLSFPDIHQKKWIIVLPIVPFIAFSLILYKAWLHDTSTVPEGTHGLECLICIALFSSFSALVMMVFLRRQATTHYYLAGAVAFLAASSLGAMTFTLCEPVDSVEHLVTWHYLPMVGFMLIGMVFGKKLLRW